MIEAFLAWLVGLFLLGPIKAEVAARLEAARAPVAVVERIGACTAEVVPRLGERAVADPLWAAGTVVRLWIGTIPLDALLREATPDCQRTMREAMPFFRASPPPA
jgi:hypothetical protein